MFEATVSMLDAGIEDILYLYNSNSYSGVKKLGGFRAAMEAHSVPDYEKRILFYEGDPQQMDDVANYLERLSKKKLSFHGVIASEDPLAIGAMKYARRQGLSVPEDLSVIGYNNSMLTTCCTPELTSVDNRLETQTHQLVQTLLEFSRVRKCRRNPFFRQTYQTRHYIILRFSNIPRTTYGGKKVKTFMDKDFYWTETAKSCTTIMQQPHRFWITTATSTRRRFMRTVSSRISHRYGSAATIINGVSCVPAA